MSKENNLQKTILNNIVNHEEYCRQVLPHIKASYFEDEFKAVYDLILDFIGTHNKIPNSVILEIELKKNDRIINSKNAQEALELIKTFEDRIEVEKEWLLASTEKWCKDRAIFLALMESYTIIEGKHPDKSEGAIPELLQQALAVTFDTNVGHDYLENAEERFEYYHSEESRIPFDLDTFNRMTKGGIAPKTLNVLMAGPNVGKSLVMCHLAAAYLAAGLNVLYITMEMAEEKISERIDQNLFDLTHEEIMGLNKSQFMGRVGKIKSKTQGKFIIKEYPTGAAHVGHFRALLSELKLKKNFKPQVIFIDYLNICASSRIKGLGGGVGTYNLVGAIAQELRGLGVEYNLPVWTATQVNREGFKSADNELSDTSDSFGVPAIADFFLALTVTEELEKLGQMMVKQLKSRYDDKNNMKRVLIGVDRPKMRLYDLDDPSAGLIKEEAPEPAQTNVTPFSIGNRSRRVDTRGFKT